MCVRPALPMAVKIDCDISGFEASMAQVVAQMFRVPVDLVRIERQTRFAALEDEQKRFYEDIVQPWVKKNAGITSGPH